MGSGKKKKTILGLGCLGCAKFFILGKMRSWASQIFYTKSIFSTKEKPPVFDPSERPILGPLGL